MGSQSCIGLLLVLSLGFVYQLQAYQHVVGGKFGWTVNPHEKYNHWAERTRFKVNDTLFFKYKQGSDSVLVVKKKDYDACNTKRPLSSLTDGQSIFKFDRSGPFYFISGNEENCKNGEKLVIVVLAERGHSKPPPIKAPSQSPPTQPPSQVLPLPSPPQPADSETKPPTEASHVANSPAPSPTSSVTSKGIGGLVIVGVHTTISFVAGALFGLI